MITPLLIDKTTVRTLQISKKEAKALISCELLALLLFKNHEPGRSVCAPHELRTDARPSFSYYTNKNGDSCWKDHGTGEGGDVFALLAKAQGCDFQEALQTVKALAVRRLECGNDDDFLDSLEVLGIHLPSRDCLDTKSTKPAPRPDFADKLAAPGKIPPGFTETIASVRGLHHNQGLLLAIERGILRHCPHPFEHRFGPQALALTDDALLNANVRRLDGLPWWGGRKAFALKSSWAGWTVGIADARNRPNILLLEGIDLLAALTLLSEQCQGIIDDWGCVAMMGTSRIHEQALPHFAGKHVRIVPHIDSNCAGQKAAAHWLTQLESVGATVSAFDLTRVLDGGGKDLNDAYRINAKSLNNLFAL